MVFFIHQPSLLSRAQSQRWDKCQEMLDATNCNINRRSAKGKTFLHLTALHGQDDLISKAIEYGANPNAKDEMGNTPLHTASANSQPDSAILLLKKGADGTERGGDGWTALHYAARDGHLKLMEHLVVRGADIHAKTDYGNRPLHVATANSQGTAAELLIKLGAGANVLNSDAWTPLHNAALNGLHVVAAKLVESERNPASTCTRQPPPIHGKSPHILGGRPGGRETSAIGGISSWLLVNIDGHLGRPPIATRSSVHTFERLFPPLAFNAFALSIEMLCQRYILTT